MNYRIFIEKKDGFNLEAKRLENQLKENFKIKCNVRLLNVYDIFNTALRKRFFANESDIREACSDLVYDEMNTDIVEPSVVTK